MIRKMLVVAAAVAMPAAILAGVSGAGVASAKVLGPPTTGSCAVTGSVTFAKPGISVAGTVTNKASEKSKAAIIPSGICGTKSIKETIPTATSVCWATAPTYVSKTDFTGGTLASGAPSACDIGGESKATDPLPLSATDIKKTLKDNLYYNSSGGFVSGGLTSIVAALSGGVAVTNNGNAGTITVTSAAQILPTDSTCGGLSGFQIFGTDGFAGATHAEIDICLAGDTGTGTTNNFVADLFTSGVSITGATIGGDSNITYSA